MKEKREGRREPIKREGYGERANHISRLRRLNDGTAKMISPLARERLCASYLLIIEFI